MICSDIWHNYHEWYFEIVICKFETVLRYHKWYLSEISRTNHTIICLYYYPKRFVIFTCTYFKLSWNTTALSQSNCWNFSCSTVKPVYNSPVLINRPVFKVPIFRSYKCCICYLYKAATLYQSHVCLSLLFLPVSVLSGHPWKETKPYVILCSILLCLKCNPSSLKRNNMSYSNLILGRLVSFTLFRCHQI